MALRLGQLLIAEVKPVSPFGYQSEQSWDELFEIAERHGNWISVHTDERWGGSFELLERARNLTGKPIMAKGFHDTDDLVKQAFDTGADYVLTVGHVPESPDIDLERCLIEPLKPKHLQKFAAEGVKKLVWNSRDLATGDKKDTKLSHIRKKWGGWLCQASNIKTPEDVHPYAQAALVGTHLTKFVKHL